MLIVIVFRLGYDKLFTGFRLLSPKGDNTGITRDVTPRLGASIN